MQQQLGREPVIQIYARILCIFFLDNKGKVEMRPGSILAT
jgi:hypothetical protein